MLAGLPGRIVGGLWRSLPESIRVALLPHIVEGLPVEARLTAGLPTMEGVLRLAKANGFQPTGIVDVGANVGNWTRMATTVFAGVPVMMVEGNRDMEPALQDTGRTLGPHVTHQIGVLGPEARDAVAFYCLGEGSGVFPELTTFDRETREVPMFTLDATIGANAALGHSATGPLLLKLDVQGFELEVLRGGTATLSRTGLLMLEASVLPYNEGAPLLAEVVAFLRASGFVVYDFCGQRRRETDGTLFQTDVVFVPEGSPLRAPGKFWRAEPSQPG